MGKQRLMRGSQQRLSTMRLRKIRSHNGCRGSSALPERSGRFGACAAVDVDSMVTWIALRRGCPIFQEADGPLRIFREVSEER